MRVAVESRIEATFPDAETMRAFGGEMVLREECARQLIAQGCTGPIEYRAALADGAGVWTMRATAEREERPA